MLHDIDRLINEHQYNKELKEIRLSIGDYKKLVKELHPNIKNENILYTPLFYKGINITFGLEFKGDKK